MRHKVLTVLTILVLTGSTMAPLAFGNPKPIAFLPDPTIGRVRLQVDAQDGETLNLVRSLRVPFDITVAPGGDVQQAINAALPGETIVLQAGAAYPANLTLPLKPGTGDVTIKSSRASELPEGKRVSPAQSPLLAKLQSVVPAEPVVKTVAGAHHYRFVGIEFSTANAGDLVYDLIRFGEGRDTQTTLSAVPHHLVIDRCYIHGFGTQDVQRGISLNSAESTISNSYISEIHGVGYDTQAIAGWNGPGPFHIINNYLEGAGENVLFGGADAAIAELTPADIEIRGNYVFKPLSWKVGDPGFIPIARNGKAEHWTVKNLLELKNARNVTIDGDVFENNWTDGQSGIPILFTVRNQDCTNPFATVQKVTFTNSTVRNAEGVFNFLGKDNEAEPTYLENGKPKCGDPGESFGSVRGTDAAISNSLFHDITGPFLTNNGFYNVTLDRLTHLQKGNLTTLYGEPIQGLKYTNSVTVDHAYGLWTEAGIGVPGLSKQAPGSIIEGNVIAAPYDVSLYPANNIYPASLSLSADFRSSYSGKGADIDVLLAAQAGVVVSPTPSPTPSPSATPSPTPSPSPSPTATPAPTANPSPSPAATPSPTPSVTPTPSPTPLLPRVVQRILSTNNARRETEINQIEQNDGLKVIGCSSNICLFARRP